MKWLACGRAVVMMALAVVALAGCGRETAEGGDKSAAGGGRNTGAREVVVYCSADAPVAQPVFDAFTKKTGITVRAVYDTEATKTTGLVNRLIAEHEQGKGGPDACDVWWSSEPFGTIRLSRAGVLARYVSQSAVKDFSLAGGWPEWLRGENGDWYGFALRHRVILYNTKYVDSAAAPLYLFQLGNADWKGRIGMARPQFGTTRGHMGALFGQDAENFRLWLEALRDNGLRLYDGNAAVARAVGSGELYVGLTDNDDAAEAKQNGWPVEAVDAIDELSEAALKAAELVQTRGRGCMRIPNTVAIVAGGAHRDAARQLVDFLISEDGQRMLCDGSMRASPILAPSGPPGRSKWPPDPVSYVGIASQIEPAMKVCEEVLEGR